MKKILIADDEPNILKVLASRLRASGYEIFTASNGMEALMKAHEQKPDLIILDIRMPAGSGLNVCESLKKVKETEKIPLIFITAFPSADVKEKAKEMGVEAFISKPFEEKDLLAKVKYALGDDWDEENRKIT
jgi:two-component system alkaline phosphatase synthesis response regulator PhoP